MITIVGTSDTDIQAASALTDLRNRGYKMTAEIITSRETDMSLYSSLVGQLARKNPYVVIMRCEDSEAGHIIEHLGELHGLDHLQINPEKN